MKTTKLMSAALLLLSFTAFTQNASANDYNVLCQNQHIDAFYEIGIPPFWPNAIYLEIFSKDNSIHESFIADAVCTNQGCSYTVWAGKYQNPATPNTSKTIFKTSSLKGNGAAFTASLLLEGTSAVENLVCNTL